MSKEAMKLALEALEDCRRDSRLKYEHKFHDKVIKALEEALAKQEQGESVAWRVSYPNDPELGFWFAEGIGGEGCLNEPLYTHPQQRKPLTDEQIDKAMAENKQTLIDAADNYWKMRMAYARIIEAAHGIKE